MAFFFARKRQWEVSGVTGVGSLVRHAPGGAESLLLAKGAHQFRHALACQLLKQGASLSRDRRTPRIAATRTTHLRQGWT